MGIGSESAADARSSDKAGKTRTSGRLTPAKEKKPASRKKSAAQKPRPPTAGPLDLDPTDEQIQTRPYFICERPRPFDPPGDAKSDWLEAKRQLLSEIRPRLVARP